MWSPPMHGARIASMHKSPGSALLVLCFYILLAAVSHRTFVPTLTRRSARRLRSRAHAQDRPTGADLNTHVVVVGGGIVGLTAAYYIVGQGVKVTLVEKCGIACHSSGKGGGFLTDGDSGWHQGSIAQLAKHSFALHREIADRFGAEKIGYRKVRCVSRGSGIHASPEWLKKGVYEQGMGDQNGMAQITPYKWMDTLHAEVVSKGCEVRIGKIVGVQAQDDTVTAVQVEQDGECDYLSCTSLVLAMGAWTQKAAEWFPQSSMPRQTVSNRYTSVIWDDVEVGKDAVMVFTMGEDAHTEIYPRVNECYANGCPTTAELPDNPLDIVAPPEEVERVKAETFAAVDRLRDAEILRTAACFLAGSDDGNPVIGMVPGMSNAVVACGGGCWGILNGPAMGQAAAALALRREPEVDIAPFDPARFSQVLPGMDESSIPPKLRAILAANPDLAQLLRRHPEAIPQLLAQIEQQ